MAVPYEQFDGARFREPLYVRSYRTRMLELIDKGTRPGYGIVIKGKKNATATTTASHPVTTSASGGGPREVSIITPRPNVANIRFRLEDEGVEVHTTLVVHDGEAVQTVTLRNDGGDAQNGGGGARTVEGELSLCASVNRASYGQLTEGGPIPLPRSENVLDVADDGTRFALANRNLDARLEGCLCIGDKPVSLCGLLLQPQHQGHNGNSHLYHRRTAAVAVDGPVAASVPWKVSVPAGGTVELTARFRLRAGAEGPMAPFFPRLRSVVASASRLTSTAGEWKDARSVETHIIRRALDYIIGNCLVPVGEGCWAIVTDHVALPLGWNRDN